MFLEGPRCSSLDIDHNLDTKEKDNLTPELTQLAFNSQSKNSDKSPHETVEDFFLINDSTTVATELPVFINPEEIEEIDVDDPITGHIDLVQIRYDDLYILDYKPNLNRPERHASQLQLYIRRASLEGKKESFDSYTRKRYKSARPSRGIKNSSSHSNQVLMIPEDKIHTAVSAGLSPRIKGCNPANSTDTATTNSDDCYTYFNFTSEIF